MAIGLERLSPENSVVHDPFHAVSETRVASHAQQISRELEVRIGTTRGLETRVAIHQTGENIVAVRSTQSLIRPPASGDKALRQNHVKSIFGCAKMHFAAQRQIGLHGRAESIHMTVRMLAGERILSGCERRK